MATVIDFISNLFIHGSASIISTINSSVDMNCKQFLIMILFQTTYSKNDEGPISDEYRGEHFPVKYLNVENIVSTMRDLNHYLRSLKRTVNYFAKAPNITDVNKALGLFFAKGGAKETIWLHFFCEIAILKRTLQDDNGNLKKSHRRFIKKIINKAEYVVSHFIYLQKPFGWNDQGYRVSKLFENDESQVYSIAKFNRNRLQKWIRSNEKINDFHKEIDEASLPKEKYIELVMNMDRYFKIDESDECLAAISYNPVPIDVVKLYPCRHEPDCREQIYALPSVAYALTHRLFNIMGRRHFRRCFIYSEADDDKFMELLCSHMYREAVYIARRGYFSRDVFLEHVALCGMFGYEEFHRQHWFKKATTWMDKNGCIYEDRNFVINSTKFRAENEIDDLDYIREDMQEMLDDKCQNHPMALLAVVLAHAVRYTTATLIKHTKVSMKIK